MSDHHHNHYQQQQRHHNQYDSRFSRPYGRGNSSRGGGGVYRQNFDRERPNHQIRRGPYDRPPASPPAHHQHHPELPAEMETQLDTVFVQKLPENCNRQDLAQAFGAIGLIKMDRRTGQPKIWIYKDKFTGRGKGEATVTYEDPNSADAAIKWFNGKEVMGQVVSVQLAIRRRNMNFGGVGGGRGGGFGQRRGGDEYRGGGRGGGFGGRRRGDDRQDFGGRRPQRDFGQEHGDRFSNRYEEDRFGAGGGESGRGGAIRRPYGDDRRRQDYSDRELPY